MIYQLVIPPEIEREITEVFDAFDSTERALSFGHDLEVVFERIIERLRQFPVIHTAARRALWKRHEYSVFFELDVDLSRVVVHAVLHQRRDPAQ